MALSSFTVNCFKYLRVSKMKPICIPEFINHYRQKHPLYVFFYLKLQNLEIVGLFIPQGLWAEYILLKKNASVIDVAQVCGKKYATTLPFIPSPHPSPLPYPPPQHRLPRANDIGPFGSCDLLGQWRGVPGAQHRNPFSSVPRPSSPSCPVPAKPALPVEKKVSHSRKGYVKNTWHGSKCQWEKQTLKLRGDM